MLEEPPAAVARLAKALFALDTLIDARTTLLGNEPLADPDTAWKALHTLVTRSRMVADLLEPLLTDEALLWDAVHWIRDEDAGTPGPSAKDEWYQR
jgi:hypothetical protein